MHDPAVLLERLVEISRRLPFEVTSRPMMGGYIGYADGKPFVSLSTGGFGIKLLGADHERALQHPGAQRMRHLPEQPASKTYVTFADDDIGNDDFLARWLTLAASTAPARRSR